MSIGRATRPVPASGARRRRCRGCVPIPPWWSTPDGSLDRKVCLAAPLRSLDPWLEDHRSKSAPIFSVPMCCAAWDSRPSASPVTASRLCSPNGPCGGLRAGGRSLSRSSTAWRILDDVERSSGEDRPAGRGNPVQREVPVRASLEGSARTLLALGRRRYPPQLPSGRVALSASAGRAKRGVRIDIDECAGVNIDEHGGTVSERENERIVQPSEGEVRP